MIVKVERPEPPKGFQPIRIEFVIETQKEYDFWKNLSNASRGSILDFVNEHISERAAQLTGTWDNYELWQMLHEI